MNDMYVERFELPVLWAGGKHGNSSSLHPYTSAVHGELISLFILVIICHKLYKQIMHS